MVVHEPVPRCIISKDKHLGYKITVSVVSAFLFGMMGFVFVFQFSNTHWVTEVIKVRFSGSGGVGSYSGCYEINRDTKFSNRYLYKLLGIDLEDTATYIGYCKDDRRRVIYQPFDRYFNNPCILMESVDVELAHSGKTNAFDIGTSFEEPWYSATNEPLQLALFELGEEKICFSGCKYYFLLYFNRVCWNKRILFLTKHTYTVLSIAKDDGDGSAILSNKIGEVLQEFTSLDIGTWGNIHGISNWTNLELVVK